jgi:ATP-dependent RNA helicase DeaD
MHSVYEEIDTLEENGFESLGLKQELLSSLKKYGFKQPSPIQKDVIPLILSGSDVIGQAQTGTGKTAAFGLPAIHMLQNTGHVEVLVITPTRELTSQVCEELHRFGISSKVKVAAVYGGKSFQSQIEAIRKGAHIVVATPGRLLDLLQSGKAASLKPSLVIVDEADEMLDMGFLEDLQAIFEFLPESRQTLMFSATMPAPIQTLAKRILKNPEIVKVTKAQTSNTDIVQSYCVLHEEEKDEAVIRLFEAKEMQKTILFCKTKKEVDRLTQVLNQRGQAASALHGDMEQNQREHVTQNFRSGKSRILIATDVAARGLNIIDVSHVINFNIPYDPDNYVHRIGRTGRAGRKGEALTLVTPKELGKLMHFQQKAGGSFERAYIPSKTEIRNLQIARLLEKLSLQTPSKEMLAVIDSWKETEDLRVLASKLLSCFLAQNPIEGPETIGVSTNVDPRSPRKSRTYPPRRREDREPFRHKSSKSFSSFPKKKFSSFKSDAKRPKKA